MDQTKIHFNPDFISRGVTLPSQKVHINPAFLQKPQGVQQIHKYATPAAPSATTTGHEQSWHTLVPGASRPTSQINASLLHSQDGNTATNIYSYSSKSVHNVTVASSHSKSHSSLYKKSNLYNPYDKSFSRYNSLPQTQNLATKNSAVMKHPSTYSWKATNTNDWAPHQGNSSTSVRGQNNANQMKDYSFATQHNVYPNPASNYSSVNKSFVRNKKTVPNPLQTQPKENKLTTSHSSLYSLSHDKKDSRSLRNLVTVTGNTSPYVHVSKTHTKTSSSKITQQKSYVKVTKNMNPSFHIQEIKTPAESSNVLTQDSGVTLKKVDTLKTPNIELNATTNPSQAQVSGSLTSNLVQLNPNQKWVSQNKVVNLSSKKQIQAKVDVKNTSTKTVLKTPKQKGNYKIITKTKLVRTPSSSGTKNKLQAVAGHSPPQTSKPTTYISPRTTTNSRLYKVSPTNRIHQSATKCNKKKYSVLSRTKLVRRQSLSGKTGTPGKPKYSVITKNKLIRRRSNSGTGASKSQSKPTESKTNTNKPEPERQKKFHVLSKTKLVRRRSSSGVYKAASTQGLVAPSTNHSKKRAIIKRHKLVRNVSSSSLKHETSKFTRSFPRNVNTAFKVINTTPKLSAKQRIAKGIVSKYKINRLKLESYDVYKKYQKPFDRYKVNRFKLQSAHGSKRYRKFNDYSSRAKQKGKFKFQSKKT